MKKILLITLLMSLMFISVFLPISHEATSASGKNTDSALNGTGSIVNINNNSKGTVLVASGTQTPNNLGKASVTEHKITSSELDAFKSKIGVYVEGQNYSQLVDGHATGLRPPTEQEWTEIVANLNSVDKVSPQLALPSSVDESTKPWFPPIGNQGSQGSCVAWSVGYYVKTFQEAQEHGWNVSAARWQAGSPGYPTQDYQSEIMSPAFIYNLQNGGVDNGITFYGAINLVCSVGVCSWEKMPYVQSDYTTWPSEEAWTEAPLYRGDSAGYQYMSLSSDQGIANLKSWLVSGYLATIGVDANKYYSVLTNADVWTLNNYVNPSVDHANTIVGYDDNIAYTENGVLQYGAFKVANSWGVGGWEHVPDGFLWISYAAMKQRVGYCMIYNDLIDYKPQLAATFSITHAKRSECTIQVGVGNPNAPIVTKNFNQYIDGGSLPFCQNDILLDITEFKNYVPNIYNQSYFLQVYDGGTSTTGTINSFSIEYAQSANAPCQTVNGNTVYLNVTLPVFATTWANASLLNSDQDSIDTKIAAATDSNGNMYVAYTDLYSVTDKTAVFVRKSSDGGQTWPLIECGYFSSFNLANPSMAINPYNNEIYIVTELEVTPNDHDIWVLRYVSNSWSWSAVSSVSGQDDRFPSITCEYQYGAANRQYISYEYINNSNDRDVMFAKSTDHGSTWSLTKLHGNSPDGNVYTQTSITNAEGNIYIAYRFGADYNSVSEIRVDRSTDFGATWTQFSDVDGLSNDCQFPSIAATHGGDVVMVGFQYQWSTNDADIWYSYSTNNGTTWTKQQPLFTSSLLDEKSVTLTADGTGCIYAICKAGRFAEYKATANLQPTNWSTLKIINDGWIGDGLAINVRLVNSIYYPYAIWTDARTKNVYFSVSYNFQYQVTFSYQVLGGGSPTAPSVTYISLGSQYSVTAGQSATVWADSGSTYTYTPNPLTGSSGNERWQASAGTSGTISSSATIAPTYYHQYLMTLSYSVSGGGSPTAPTFTANRFGSSTPVTLTGSLTGSWFDAGASWTVTNPLTGSSSTERWATSTGSGTVSAAATIAFAYYHQFSLTLSYSTPGGAVASTAPTLTSTQFGVAYAPVLTGSAAAYWLDNGAAWSVTNPLGGSGVSERWDSSQTGSGTVSATQTAVFTYYHQYSITPYYTVSDSSSSSVTNVVSYTQFGSPLTVTPTLGSSGGSAVWVDAGTAVTYTSPIPGGSGERWQAASGDSGTHAAISSVSSSTPATVEYYHQYQVTASYSTSDSSTLSASVTLSGTQFGSSSYTLTLTTSSQTPWLDAETGWSVNNPITAGSGTERWDAASGISGNVIGAIIINPIYVHQYYLAVISTFGSPSGSGWYSSGSTAYASVASNTVSGGSGIQYVLTGWGGDSSGSGTTSNGITMYAPKTATASWGTQYYLTVTSPYGSPSTASGWFNAGTNINEAVTSSVPVAAGTQYVCTGWTGTGSITSSGNTPSTAFTISAPTAVNWNWKKQYYLNMSTNFGSVAPGSCWRDAGTNVTISATAPAVQNGERYLWNGWSSLNSSNNVDNSISVTMNGPLTAVASWVHQYMVTVDSPYGSPSPSTGWFNAGTDITFSVNSPAPESIISQHVCTGWTGTGSAPATGTNTSLHFTINQPSSITWNWQSQFIWPMVLLLTGVPSATVIIGLSVYLLRNSQKFRKRK